MGKIPRAIQTLVLSSVFLVCYVCGYESSGSQNAIYREGDDLERFKYELFSSKQNAKTSSSADDECSQELRKIGRGLQNSMWARQGKSSDSTITIFILIRIFFWTVVDAWGKLPSAFIDGNFYDLGGFTECLNIELDDGSLYDSKYCLGEIKFKNLKKSLAPRSYQHHTIRHGLFHHIRQPNVDDERISSRAMTS